MISFYGNVPFVRVLERFRAKTKNVWKKNIHVDTDGIKMIPSNILNIFPTGNSLRRKHINYLQKDVNIVI